MTPEGLEYEIRMLPGVIACSITAGAVTVLAAPSADTAAITDNARTLAAIAGIGAPVVVIGGVMAPPPRPLSRLRAPIAAGGAIGIGSLLAAAVATALTGGVSWVPGVGSHETATTLPLTVAEAPPQQTPAGQKPSTDRPLRGVTVAGSAAALQAAGPQETAAPPVTQQQTPAADRTVSTVLRLAPISSVRPAAPADQAPAPAVVATPPVAPSTPTPAVTPPEVRPPVVTPPVPAPDDGGDGGVTALSKKELNAQAHLLDEQAEGLAEQSRLLHANASKLREQARHMLDDAAHKAQDKDVRALTGAARQQADAAISLLQSQANALWTQSQQLDSAAAGLQASADRCTAEAQQLRAQAHTLH